MCGIAGVVEFGGVDEESVRRLKRMCAAMTHRGPDSGGFSVESECALGARRLAVIDLSRQANQPMKSLDGRYTIVFNGEVYNYQELRHRLEAQGARFRTSSDTEVVLNAIAVWGTASVERMYGMFAFAIWDNRRRELLLGRDRLGVKPLSYFVRGRRLVFASEVHPLYMWPDVDVSNIDMPAMEFYLRFGYVPATRGFVVGVNKVAPGTWLRVCEAGVETQRYWSLDYASEDIGSLGDVLDGIDRHLGRAVERRLVADVEVGAFLSGGIDSGLVTHHAARAAGRVRTYAMRFEGGDTGDVRLAAEVAKRLETLHSESSVSPLSVDELPRILFHFGEPFGDVSAVPVYRISKAARKWIKVALTGDGGDESFAGYANVRASYVGSHIAGWTPNQLIRFVDARSSRVVSGEVEGSEKSRTARAMRFWRQYVAGDINRQLDLRNHWCHDLRRPLMAADWDGASDEILEDTFAGRDGLKGPEMQQVFDLEVRLPGDYLTKVDIASNLASLEVRSPFLDHELVDFAMKLPIGTKLLGWRQKGLLRKYAAGRLPDEVVTAPKRGFGPPLGEWLRGPWRRALTELLLVRLGTRGIFESSMIERCVGQHLQGGWDHTQRLWSLVALELWFELFVDRTLSMEEALVW